MTVRNIFGGNIRLQPPALQPPSWRSPRTSSPAPKNSTVPPSKLSSPRSTPPSSASRAASRNDSTSPTASSDSSCSAPQRCSRAGAMPPPPSAGFFTTPSSPHAAPPPMSPPPRTTSSQPMPTRATQPLPTAGCHICLGNAGDCRMALAGPLGVLTDLAPRRKIIPMTWLWYLLLVALQFTGLFLTILGLPGLWLMVATLVGYAWLTTMGHYVGWTSLIAVLALALIAEVLEFYVGSAGAKKAGASRRGMLGALVGALIGGFVFTIPVPILGTIFGVCVGAFLGAALVAMGIVGDAGHAHRVD